MIEGTDRAEAAPAVDGEVAVLIPALDEEEAIRSAIDALPPELAGRVVVVDNGSGDGTPEVARAAGARVVREPRRGYGRACLTGLRFLRAQPAPPSVVLFIDADHRHHAEDLRRVVSPAASREADLVLGVRVPAAGTGRPLRALWGTAGVLELARALNGVRFRDLPPVRAIRVPALERLRLDDPGYGWTLQMQLRAHHAGLVVREVEVPHRERTEGRSKISGSLGASLRAGVRMIRVVMAERRWSPPGSPAPPPGTPRGAPPGGGGRTPG